MSSKTYVLGGYCRKAHLLTPNNTYTEGFRLRCKDCRDIWKPAHPVGHLKNCPHDGSEHVQRPNKTWVCRACQREAMQERRAAEGPGIGQGGFNKAKTHCPKKHKYTEENTSWYKNKRHCKECNQENSRRQTVKQYGITLEQWDGMLIAQGGRCAICPVILLDPHVDHDHSCCPGRKSCGKCVRMLLCKNCNTGLGCFLDSIPILKSAIEYLEGFTLGK
jgi:Recombination endonuclease VII